MPSYPVAMAVLAAAYPLAAQAVHTVGPGGFAQIQAAIQAAVDGDTIVVQPGTYLPFHLTKGLRITAAPGALVDIQDPNPWNTAITTLQPSTQATIVGLRFRISTLPWYANTQVRVLGGVAAFADCAFEGHGYLQMLAAPLVQDASVALQRCIVLGGGVQQTLANGSGDGFDALEVRHGTVAAVDSVFVGGALGWDNTGHGGHAVLVDDGSVHLAGCIALGGRHAGPFAGYLPGDGVRIVSTSRLWLADCEVRGGPSVYSLGGNGVTNLGTIAAVQARSILAGGAGQPPGATVVGPLTTGPLVGFAAPVPAITLGSTWTIDYRATPLTPFLAVWSDRLLPATTAAVAEPAWLPATQVAVAAIGTTDANGLLSLNFPVPAAPSLLHAACFVQGVAGVTLPLEVAPPVGGLVR
jgi:hypothetical protein